LGIEKTQAYQILADKGDNDPKERPSSRTLQRQVQDNPRGAHPKISEYQTQVIEDIVENCDWESRKLT
jgi:hypothetical protein